MNRRKFIKQSTLAVSVTQLPFADRVLRDDHKQSLPVVLSTWDFGKKANDEAWKVLAAGGKALDAVEKGVMDAEADPSNQTVGYGGRPDRDGRVTLDACIMDDQHRAGSVACLEHIMHPISVARKVMEETPHVMLVGDGALQFALQKGFQKTNLLTPQSKADWEKWLVTSQYKPIINIENHDTIGMIAIDQAGNLSGACTTSGLSYKMHGRVGDSPVIGAGLYVDNQVGAAVCTGVGEHVLRNLCSFLVVELMRQGQSPQKACEEAVKRIIGNTPQFKDIQVGMLALNKKGEVGAHAIHKGFSYAIKNREEDMVKASSFTYQS